MAQPAPPPYTAIEPREDAHATLARLLHGAGPAVNPGRPLVLLVEDDDSVRQALGRLIGISGLEVVAFSSARGFLAYQRPGRPTCLVLDIYLPDGNGIDLLERLAAADPGLPVVLITAQLDEGVRRKALGAGAFAFLVKPLDSDQLLGAIRRALAASGDGTAERGEPPGAR